MDLELCAAQSEAEPKEFACGPTKATKHGSQCKGAEGLIFTNITWSSDTSHPNLGFPMLGIGDIDHMDLTTCPSILQWDQYWTFTVAAIIRIAG